MNQVTISGIIVKCCSSETKNGLPAANFVLRLGGQPKDSFVRVNYFDNLAEEFASILKEGDQVVVTGKIMNRVNTTGNYLTEVKAMSIDLSVNTKEKKEA